MTNLSLPALRPRSLLALSLVAGLSSLSTGALAQATDTLSPACASFYPADFKLSSTRTTDAIPTTARPAKGVATREGAYNTCLVRATNHTAEGVSGFSRNDYARRQAFNADSSQYLTYALNGFWQTYNAKTFSFSKQLPGLAGDAEPQWHPTNPDKLYYLPTNGVGMRLNELTVSTGATRVVGDFAARLKARWPGANAAWTKSEGSPSKDGRYWCFMVDDANWKSLGVFTWDRDTNSILGTYNTNGERPDHVSMSPSGNYCVISGDGASGTLVANRDFSNRRKIHPKSEHSDLAIDANGDDVYVSVDYQSNAGDVFMVNLRTGVRTNLFPTYLNGSATALHISGKGFNKPGWALVSTYGDSGTRQWLHRKMFLVQLAANPVTYNLGFSRVSSNGYWSEPHASVNRDLTKVLFNSNWGTSSDTDVDAYMIEVPASAVKTIPGTGTPTTPPPATPALAITLGTVTHSGYDASYALTTNQPAKCRASWTAGNAYGALYDNLLSSTDGLKHSKALTLGSTAAQTVYAVCKSDSQGTEKEQAILLK
ncbi:hypothetical protein [Massilia scottii]|uniref:hypothetical protein n=1 Tax=Massilia scottii TaxID=3057166 RepID=UPI0027967B62|nr:hypothetical protein [Massilia sp. CCM 9029]MDQ1831183.1 hypothetical protein [Massilia sp. CCM 9029]